MLMKDVSLLKGQKQFFGALLILLIMFTMIQSNPTFAVMYVTLMFSIMTMTTMSYDDFENGMCYLLTLPVSRREYVTEKYIFGMLSSVTGLTVASLFTVVSVRIKGGVYPWDEWKATVAACMILIILVLSVSLPVQLKFGSEKSRMAMFGIFAVASLLAIAVVKLCGTAGIEIEKVMESAIVENLTTTVWGLCITGLAVLGISWLVSVRVLERREF